MTISPETRRAFERAFLQALDPDSESCVPSTPSPGHRVDSAELAALYSALDERLWTRLRKIPDEIGEQLQFAARRGREDVRQLIADAIDRALREFSENGD
jgi:hypothetical protein